MTDKDIKKALARCSGAVDCRCCPLKTTENCIGVMSESALKRIEQLERQVKALTDEIDRGVVACHECHARREKEVKK